MDNKLKNNKEKCENCLWHYVRLVLEGEPMVMCNLKNESVSRNDCCGSFSDKEAFTAFWKGI